MLNQPATIKARRNSNRSVTVSNTGKRKPVKKNRGKTKFPGIGSDAEILKVHRMHLFWVLTGKRHSPKLVESYNKLQAAKAARRSK